MSELTPEQRVDKLRKICAEVGFQYDGTTPVAQLPLEDWMRFHLSHMWAELRDEGTASNQAMLIDAKGDAIMVNLHFCDPKLVPLAMLQMIEQHKCTRAVFMAEVWSAPDNRTAAERAAGAPQRQPRDREDREEALVAYGWEWGREVQVAMKWPIDRDPDAKPVMRGFPQIAASSHGPLHIVAKAMYAVSQKTKSQTAN